MKRLFTAGMLFLLVGVTFFYIDGFKFIHSLAKPLRQFEVHRVAHAGGGINDKAYTNSYEALDYNVKRGFKYFELDFIFTSDGQLVCHRAKKTSEFKHLKSTLEQFEKREQAKPKYTRCTLAGLSAWMKRNSGASIVTDVKRSNLFALKIIMDTLPDAKTRVIPQVFFPENLAQVQEMGYKKIIWTLYRAKVTNDEVIEWVRKTKSPLAITMPEEVAKTDLPKKLKEMNIETYVHTINSNDDADEYFSKYSVSEIYTDFLPPIMNAKEK